MGEHDGLFFYMYLLPEASKYFSFLLRFLQLLLQVKEEGKGGKLLTGVKHIHMICNRPDSRIAPVFKYFMLRPNDSFWKKFTAYVLLKTSSSYLMNTLPIESKHLPSCRCRSQTSPRRLLAPECQWTPHGRLEQACTRMLPDVQFRQ